MESRGYIWVINIQWKKNKLSKELKKTDQRVRKKFFPLLGIALLCFAYIILPILEVLEESTSFVQAYYNNPTWLNLFLLFFPSGILGITYIAMWISEKGNPKYISSDEEGIKIINRRNKKDFIPWDKVYNIARAGKINSKEKKFPEYILLIKDTLRFNSFRFNSALYLNPEIGKELQEEWTKHGGEIEGEIRGEITEPYKPPGEK